MIRMASRTAIARPQHSPQLHLPNWRALSEMARRACGWFPREYRLLSVRDRRQATLLILLIVLVATSILGSVTGKFGATRVRGGSMGETAPEGSTVWSVPIYPWTGCRVIAQVKGDPRASEAADRKPGRVLKKYNGAGLESETAPTKYAKGDFEVLSVVIAVWHTERWFPWMNTGDLASAPNRPKITLEKHIKAVFNVGYQKSKLDKQLWWMADQKVIAGKSLASRMTSAPAVDLRKASDRAVGDTPADTSKAALSEVAFTATINVENLNGWLVFKPVVFVSSNGHWSVCVDGKEVAGKELGGFVVVPMKGAHQVRLTNGLVYVPSNKRSPGCIMCCGLEEVLFLDR